LEDLAPQQLADFLSVELVAQELRGSEWIWSPKKSLLGGDWNMNGLW
jgi:hypothetical protein